MGHVIRIQSREQYKAALKVLDYLPGTWHSRGPTESAVLFVNEEHYRALLKAGVITNGKEGNSHGKKAASKKAQP